MINVDTTEKQLNRKKVRMRNNYADLWALVLVILYIVGCYMCFNTINPFTSTWGFIRIASKEEVEVKLDKKTTMIANNYREAYIRNLVNELEKTDFTIVDEQTHLLNVSKDGLNYTYKFLEKELVGNSYTLVVYEETE